MPLTPSLYAKRRKSQAFVKRQRNNMTTLQIIGLVGLVGGVLGYGALFLWIIPYPQRLGLIVALMIRFDGREYLGQ